MPTEHPRLGQPPVAKNARVIFCGHPSPFFVRRCRSPLTFECSYRTRGGALLWFGPAMTEDAASGRREFRATRKSGITKTNGKSAWILHADLIGRRLSSFKYIKRGPRFVFGNRGPAVCFSLAPFCCVRISYLLYHYDVTHKRRFDVYNCVRWICEDRTLRLGDG